MGLVVGDARLEYRSMTTTFDARRRAAATEPAVTVVLDSDAMPDLAPEIVRQRLVVEGYPARPVDDTAVRDYLSRLADVCGMTTLIEPVTHRSERYGWAGWTHWETSGAHFYAWEQPRLFFSVDIYTCKPFDVDAVVTFTSTFFETTAIVAKAF